SCRPSDRRGDRAPALLYFDEILPRQLQRRLYCFRSTGDEIGVRQPGRGAIDQEARQFLRHLGGEEGGMGIGKAFGLALYGLDDRRMAVAEPGDRRAAAGKIFLSLSRRGLQPIATSRTRR